MKTLTICIPTYNREKKIIECLDSITSQLNEEIKQEVDIYIFDNASPDNTSLVCKKYCEMFDNIHYFRNETNIGPDGNFLKVFRTKYTSKFMHIMSDDDVYTNDSLKELVSYLKSYSHAHFVYLNLEYFSEDRYQYNSKHMFLDKKSIKKDPKKYANIDKRTFISIIKNEISFLSGMIFNVSYINTDSGDSFKNTYWLQSYILLQSTKNSNNDLCFYNKPVVAKRDTNEEPSWNRFVVFGENYYILMKYAFEQCNYDKRQLLKIISKRWTKLIYWAKCNNIIKEEYSTIINIAKKEKMKNVIIANKTPSFLFKLFFKIKKIFR